MTYKPSSSMVKKILMYRFPYVIYGWMIPISRVPDLPKESRSIAAREFSRPPRAALQYIASLGSRALAQIGIAAAALAVASIAAAGVAAVDCWESRQAAAAAGGGGVNAVGCGCRAARIHRPRAPPPPSTAAPLRAGPPIRAPPPARRPNANPSTSRPTPRTRTALARP